MKTIQKTALVMVILATQANGAFSQDLDENVSYFWDANVVSSFLSSPVFLTILFVGCGAAIFLTICSVATERHLWKASSPVSENGASAQETTFRAVDDPKPACRVLQHFINLLPPLKQ